MFPKTQDEGCKPSSRVSIPHQHTSDPYARGPSSPCKYEGFFKLLWSSTHYDQLVGPSTSSDFFKSFFIKQGSSWFSSTTSTTLGDLQWSRYIKTSHVGLPDLLPRYHDIIIAWMTTKWVINASLTHLGFLQRSSRLQDHFQVPDGNFKIQACGYKDLVNWVQGASRHKPTL